METAILQPIGKGQFTIPLAWRKKLQIIGESVEAVFTGTEVLIRPIQKKAWDISQISLNQLSEETQAVVSEGRKNYKEGKTEKFLSFDEVFKN